MEKMFELDEDAGMCFERFEEDDPACMVCGLAEACKDATMDLELEKIMMDVRPIAR